MGSSKARNSAFAVSRSLGMLGNDWTLLILREAMSETTRFSEFRSSLGITADVLSRRLNTLVEYGVMSRMPYREPGCRTRHEYTLTDAGRELEVVLCALEQWGDKFLPWTSEPSIERRARESNRLVHVAFIDDRGREVPWQEVATVRPDAYHQGIAGAAGRQ
ncbi:winged helix-turn-helix transcriptional regulator [Streptomyces sp. NPDC060205]|uniref:winged helix-turn-helix transcriptional regulator n=1 Tax=Streptomyces sp. NPDC060205 TaxID=3347072 RepID=UPI003658BE55